MAALSASYIGLSMALRTLTGRGRVDGIIGVVLGLYVCSHPARHFLDMLLYWRIERPRFPTRKAISWWITLNSLVLFVGWLVIAFGVTRFV